METCLSWYLAELRGLEDRLYPAPAYIPGVTELHPYGHYIAERTYMPLTGGGYGQTARVRYEGPMNSVVRFTVA